MTFISQETYETYKSRLFDSHNWLICTFCTFKSCDVCKPNMTLVSTSHLTYKNISKSLPNFTWQILCFLTSKKIWQVKKVHLQQFGIIHLSNPDLTYIGRETKLCFYSSTSWKLKSWKKQNYFYTLPPLLLRKDASRIAARIYTRAEYVFPNLG
jgi:hypothetical protein